MGRGGQTSNVLPPLLTGALALFRVAQFFKQPAQFPAHFPRRFHDHLPGRYLHPDLQHLRMFAQALADGAGAPRTFDVLHLKLIGSISLDARSSVIMAQ